MQIPCELIIFNMSALINRSLTTVRTELEFLRDSDVINEELYRKLTNALPERYQKDMAPWGVEKINAAVPTVSNDTVEKLSNDFKNSQLSTPISTPPVSAPPYSPTAEKSNVIGYYKAIYDYTAQEADDLSFSKDDLLAVVEQLSPDWWKGYKKSESEKIGVFPSNYVYQISQKDFEGSNRIAAAAPEKQDYNRPGLYAPEQQVQTFNQQYQPYQQQGYSANYNSPSQPPFPPQSTNYYPQQDQQQMQQQQMQQQNTPNSLQQAGQNHPHLKKFGSKLGNAAIFGAGATIGSDIVNAIF